MRECAYFGDDSSEEVDELERIGKEKTKNEEDGQSNEPWLMKKARPGVFFHGSQHQNVNTKHRLSKEIASDNYNDVPQEWYFVKGKDNLNKKYLDVNTMRRTEKVINEPVYNEAITGTFSEVNEKTRAGAVIKKSSKKKNESEEVYEEVLNKIKGLGNRGKVMLKKLHKTLNDDGEEEEEKLNGRSKRNIELNTMYEDFNKDDEEYDAAEEAVRICSNS